MKRSRKLQILAALLACVCVVAALAGCSSSASSSSASSKSDEALSVTDAPIEYTEPFYVLVVGNDTRIGTVEINSATYSDGTGRSDTMMLVRIDPVKYQITIVTIPRDTAAEVDGYKTKINQAYETGGIQATVNQVKELTGIAPLYYLNMTFVQFENFVNEFGGIDVYVPTDMSLQDIVSGEQISLSEGEQHLNGAEALVLARVRKIYLENLDAVRQINDRAIVAAGITMAANNPSIVPMACEVLIENAETNWNLRDLENLAADFAAHADQITILSGTGPYDGDIDEETGEWLATRDEETWAELMDVVNNGGDPTDVVELPEMLV